MVLFLVIYLGQLYVSDYAADIPMEDISAALEKVDNVADLPAQVPMDSDVSISWMRIPQPTVIFARQLLPWLWKRFL